MKIAVIVVSDRAYNGIYEDKSGNTIVNIIKAFRDDYEVEKIIVPDDYEKILNAFKNCKNFDYIITCGGTGISSRDITHIVTKDYIDKEIAGISEYLRFKSFEETSFAVFSNAISGIKNKTIIINIPGSEKAASFCTNLLLNLFEHGIKMLNDEGH